MPFDNAKNSKSGAERSLDPKTQVAFLGFFSLVYTGVYSGIAAFNDYRSVPPWYYFVSQLSLYIICWFSFYNRALGRMFSAVGRYGYKLGRLLGETGRSGGGTAVPNPEEAGNLVRPRRYEKPRSAKWPLSESARVQVLGFGIVTLAGWYTIYCGGPFLSPFGLIFFALPLLSPNIASLSWSIAIIFLVTIAEAFIFKEIAPERESLPDASWYEATTLCILALSGLVSWLVRRSDEVTYAVIQAPEK